MAPLPPRRPRDGERAQTVRWCPYCVGVMLCTLLGRYWTCTRCGGADGLELPTWAQPFPGDGLTNDPEADAIIK